MRRRVGAAVVMGLPIAAVTARLLRSVRRPAPLAPRPGAVPAGGVTVVIPARDEAARIGPCLAGVVGDPGVARVVVVDDESADGTAAVARAAGAEVLTGTTLPDGWAGKTWALHQGVATATTRWVLCLDADTRPAPGLAAALVERAVATGAVVTSGAARFVCTRTIEAAVHASMLTTLVYRFGAPGTGGGNSGAPRLANGQCMLLDRERFVAAGGWERVRGSLVEDVALVRSLAADGHCCDFVDAAPALSVRMYDGAAATWRGWGRSLPLAEVTTRPRLAADLAVVWGAQAAPLVAVAVALARGRRPNPVALAGLALRLGTLAGTAAAYERAGVGYWLSPLADVAVAGRLTRSALRPERRWRGRTYPAVSGGVLPADRPAPPGRSAGR
jgi:dolichol-phosphate mannosyltransferase